MANFCSVVSVPVATATTTTATAIRAASPGSSPSASPATSRPPSPASSNTTTTGRHTHGHLDEWPDEDPTAQARSIHLGEIYQQVPKDQVGDLIANKGLSGYRLLWRETSLPAKNQHDGYCWVEFRTAEMAGRAAKALRGLWFGGRRLKVGKVVKTKPTARRAAKKPAAPKKQQQQQQKAVVSAKRVVTHTNNSSSSTAAVAAKKTEKKAEEAKVADLISIDDEPLAAEANPVVVVPAVEAKKLVPCPWSGCSCNL